MTYYTASVNWLKKKQHTKKPDTREEDLCSINNIHISYIYIYICVFVHIGEGHSHPLQYSCLENSHGQRNLVGYSPWGHKELDMTERLSTYVYVCVCVYSCSVTQSCLTLCHPMDCSTPGFPVLHHLLELAERHVH